MTTPPKRQLVPFGKYLLLDRVNIGGMAEVWRGKSFTPVGQERIVAVKRILPNIAEDEEFIAMFMDEARISVQLAHSNIAQILDFDFERTHNSYYLVMEYIPGKDLRALYDRCRKLGNQAPVALVCYVMSKVCEALDYAHRKRDGAGREMNIVHRDVSPQNVLLAYSGEVKVIDFGIAKAAGKATRTQAGILKGKFAYMSPEQIRGVELDRRSDIFAIGVCLFELLTGQRLFSGGSDYSVLEKVRKAEIPPPSKINGQIPGALEKVVFKALAREVEDRYQHASEMSEELQHFLASLETPFGRKDLAQFMKSTFPEEVEKERVRDLEYAEIHGPIPAAALAAPRRPSRDGIRALTPPVTPSPAPPALASSPGAANVAPGLAPLPALKSRTTSGAGGLKALAPSLPTQEPASEEEGRTVMHGDSSALPGDVFSDETQLPLPTTPHLPAIHQEDAASLPNTLWDKGDKADLSETLPADPLTRTDRLPPGGFQPVLVPLPPQAFFSQEPSRPSEEGLAEEGKTSVTGAQTEGAPEPESHDTAPSLPAVARPAPELTAPRPSVPKSAGPVVSAALAAPSRAATVGSRTSLRTAQIVGLVGLAAILVSLALVAVSVLHKSSYVYVDVQPELQDRARVQINDDSLGHPKQWPVEYAVHKGPVVVLVTAEGYQPYREDLEVKGHGRMVQAQLLPLQDSTKLIIITDPVGAEIELDGKRVRKAGERGVYVGDLPLGGPKLLEVRAAGYRTFTKALAAMHSHDPVTVEARLEPVDYAVRIFSHPEGAQVYANGRLMGTTPLTFKSTGGAVAVHHRCYADAQATLPPPSASGEPVQVPVDLRRLPGCH